MPESAIKAPVEEITPLGGQAVRIKIPSGRKAGEARLLVSGQTVKPEVENGEAVVRIAHIDGAHEVVALELR